MDWNATTIWWLTAGILVAAELATGTFYLLMLAVGAAAGALAAHLGLAASAQVTMGAVVGSATTAIWHWRRLRHPPAAPAAHNADVNLDIGQRVHVAAWSPEGTARVRYRGADWAVRWAGPGAAVPGALVIAAVHGAELQLVPPQA